MPNTQYYNPSYPGMNWSGEISGPQPTAHTHTTTSTTTTTSSSASAGLQGMPAPITTTTTDTDVSTPTSSGVSAAPAGQQSVPAGQQPVPAGQQSVPAGQQPVPAAQSQGGALTAPAVPRSEFHGSTGTLDLETHQPIEVIEAPASLNEAFLGSLKSMLLRNKGAFVTATFLIGTQGTTTWEGILHDVGNDYLIIFQPGRQRYIASDIYSLKYIEFYDTRQREICEQLLRENGLDAF